MNLQLIEIESEIKQLNTKIIDKRKMLDAGLKAKVRFLELKTLHSEIKDLERKLDFCFEESNVLRNME